MTTQHLSASEALAARFDVAAICTVLTRTAAGATERDLHLFSYLAAMVQVLRGSPPSSWSYRFAATENGQPFAEAISSTVDEMQRSGEIVEGDDGWTLDPNFASVYRALSQGAYSERVKLLEAVCSVSAFRSLPSIGRAIRREPQMSRSAALDTVRIIEDDAFQSSLLKLAAHIADRLPADGFHSALPITLWLDEWEQPDAE